MAGKHRREDRFVSGRISNRIRESLLGKVSINPERGVERATPEAQAEHSGHPLTGRQ